jgi:hypothetical protein
MVSQFLSQSNWGVAKKNTMQIGESLYQLQSFKSRSETLIQPPNGSRSVAIPPVFKVAFRGASRLDDDDSDPKGSIALYKPLTP